MRGFGRVTPVVSDTAETSIAEGGAIVLVRVLSQVYGRQDRINGQRYVRQLRYKGRYNVELLLI